MKRYLLAAVCLLPLPALAGDFLPGGNSGALARGFALPGMDQAEVLTGGRYQTRALLDFTSEFVAEMKGGEELRLDGETTRLLLSHRRGLGAGWDFSIELPLLSQSGGFLDSAIEEWHGWFGLPNGGREQAQRDKYLYRYDRSSTAQVDLNVTESYSGFGDFTLGLGRALGKNVALRGMVKLPTGDDLRLGGGNKGAALWLAAVLPLPDNFHGYAAAGASFNDRGTVLPEMQNTELAFGGLGLTMPVPFSERVRILIQLYAHSRLYKGSDLTALSRFGLPMTLGLQVRTGRQTRFDLGFQEDLSVNASPDFTAYLAFTYSAK